MLFNSLDFIFCFLPIAFIGWWMLKNHTAPRLIYLTLASYIFYAYWDWRFVGLMLLSTVVDYWCGYYLAYAVDLKAKKGWLIISLASNLTLLGFFKYFGFFLDSVNEVCKAAGIEWAAPALNIILPAGISFYTFSSMSYCIDLYKGLIQPAKSFLHFAVYISLFPHLIAGPIVRYSYIEDQLRDLKVSITYNDIWLGLSFFVWGLAEKVLIADRVANYAAQFFEAYNTMTFLSAWAAMLSYAYQIFFDFSGYSCMAVGLAILIGFKLPQNFNSPYKALNPSDFWRRWHITLSDWLRDYLYFSLGGSRGGKWKTIRNLVITMFLGGLWHGAAWTYVVWGLYHGLLLAIYHVTSAVKLWPENVVIARGITFIAVLFGWVLFRSDNWEMANEINGALLGFNGFKLIDLPDRFVLLLLFCFLWTNFGPNAWEMKFKPSIPGAVLMCGVFVWVILLLSAPSPFLYFQF